MIRRTAPMLALVLLCGCAPRATPTTGDRGDLVVTGQAMGGELRIIVRCEHAHWPRCQDDALDARRRVQQLHDLATDWTAEGEIARLNASGGEPVAVSADVAQMLAEALRVARATDGAFDPTINAIWGMWDFRAGLQPEADPLATRLQFVDWTDLSVGEAADGSGEAWARLESSDMSVTLGGLAQGYAASRALEHIEGREAMVDVSGDIAVRGRWTLGIQHPRRPRGVPILQLTLEDAVLSTSGDYENFFERDGRRYHHILDPRTGYPAVAARSATVVHSEGAIADALATALMVLGPDPAVVEALDAWAYVIDADGVAHTLGRPDGRVSAIRPLE